MKNHADIQRLVLKGIVMSLQKSVTKKQRQRQAVHHRKDSLPLEAYAKMEYTELCTRNQSAAAAVFE